MIVNIKADWDNKQKEWAKYERIIVSNKTVIKRTYGDEHSHEEIIRWAIDKGAFMDKMELPVDFNNYNDE